MNDGLKRCPNCNNWIPQNAQYCPFCGSSFDEIEEKRIVKFDTHKIMLFVAGVITTIVLLLLFRWVSVRTPDQDASSGSDTSAVLNIGEEESNTGVSTTSNPEPITAIEPVAALREINSAMSDYIYVTLLTQADKGNTESSVDIELTDTEKIRAAVLASEPDGRLDSDFRLEDGRIVRDAHVKTGPNGNGYHGLSVSENDVEQNCRNLFGTNANWEHLQTEVKCPLYDAVKYTDSSVTYAVIVDTEVDTELAQESHNYIAVKNGDSYIGEVEIFWGYWGMLKCDPELSNYKITYGLLIDDSSKYGMVISSIRISKIDAADTPTGNVDSMETDSDSTESPTSEVQNRPFYGIWCFASKDQQEAQQIAEDLRNIGFDGQVYISSEWSNLNPEKWYCSSAGTCYTKSEAETVLDAIQAAGYSDAYIKYSGNYIG